MGNRIELFLDSGAFSAFTQNTEIDIDEYIQFIKDHEEQLSVYANLDDINSAKNTLDNQKRMESEGLTPLPCYHYGEDPDFLSHYVAHYDYIALGGMVPVSTKNLIPWLDTLFSEHLTDENGMPKVKVHGFGLTSLRLMRRYPWYSVDSTSWVVTGRLGSVCVPKFREGAHVYDVDPWKVSVSSRSPNRKEAGEHLTTFSPRAREIIEAYFTLKGFVLGSSEFKIESKDYELKDNEKFISKAVDGKRDVEIAIVPGLSNDYRERDKLNIMYYMDLEKTFPEFPWAYQKAVQRAAFDI